MGQPKIGLYLRLSRDDGEDTESQSIVNQRAFLHQYLVQQGYVGAIEFIDDGYTGTNFNRPDFQRMIGEIEAGRIDTVITKDLSRLGRDQIGTMYYFQVYFPGRGVRYLSIAEGIDTASPGGMSKVLPFLAAANDFYPADISGKVRNALTTRKKEGLFIGSQPPLGYLKDPCKKGHLIIDSETAPIIGVVFCDYLTNGSVIGTAKRLTEQGIPTPSQCKGNAASSQRFPGVWSDNMVRRILTNPTYAGNLTQNRSEKVNYKVEKRKILSPSEWITVADTHQAIISPVDFARVQEMIAIHSYTPRSSGGGHLLTGLAFCADCGSPMTYVRESNTRIYMVCQGYRKGGRLGLCTAHCVREEFVIESIRGKLQELARELDGAAMARQLPPDRGREQLRRQMETSRRKLEGCKAVAQSLYTDKATRILTQTEFEELFQRNRDQRVQLENHLSQCEGQLSRSTGDDLYKKVCQILRFETLDRGILLALVERVLIYESKEIGLFFRFGKPHERKNGSH
ncbi:MAG: recombinase family protein [Oscillospiraceae bacterium]